MSVEHDPLWLPTEKQQIKRIVIINGSILKQTPLDDIISACIVADIQPVKDILNIFKSFKLYAGLRINMKKHKYVLVLVLKNGRNSF